MAKFTKRWAITVSLLRGALFLIGGLFALFLPQAALRVAVVVGGTMLILDGILGALASQNYGIERSWPLGLSIARGVLACIAGVLLLASPLLVSSIPIDTLSLLIGLGAIAIGLTEAFILLRYRKEFPPLWTSALGAALYVALGCLLIALPLTGALFPTQVGGSLVALFGVVEIVRSWNEANQRLARE